MNNPPIDTKVVCPKCNGNMFDAPCLYPNNNYQDCGHPLVGWIQVFGVAGDNSVIETIVSPTKEK
jgi:hypothetical protein